MPGRGRTLQAEGRLFWPIWPMPEAREAFRRSRQTASDRARPRGAYSLAAIHSRRGTSRAPDDCRVALRCLAHRPARHGGHRRRQRLRSAVAAEWPRTRVQRCVFHAFCQVKRHTTSRPKLQAGVELYALARSCCMWRRSICADWVGRALPCSGASSGPTSSSRKAWSKAAWPTPTAGCARRGRGSSGSSTRGRCLRTRPGAVRRGADARHQQHDRGGVNSQLREVQDATAASRSSSASRPCSGGATCMSNARRRWRTRCARCPPTPTSTC